MRLARRNPRRLTRRGSRRLPRRDRRGLLTVLLTILVAAVVIAGIFAAYNQISGTSTATRTMIFIRQLVPQISQRYRGDYTGISAATVIGSGFVPSDWRSGEEIKGPDGAAVKIEVATRTTGRFVISFVGGIATQTCQAVLSALESEPAFHAARVGGSFAGRGDLFTPGGIDAGCAQSRDGNFALVFR